MKVLERFSSGSTTSQGRAQGSRGGGPPAEKLLRELGVPDLSPEEIAEKARARAAQGHVRDALAEQDP
jgi:hypothetical protein